MFACGGQKTPAPDYQPLEVGADYATYKKLNKTPFVSPTHGNRRVDVYVNEIGAEAYKNDAAEMPVGSVIVKTSWETKNGEATDVAGPIFVMQKRAQGDDWWYALHWETVPPNWQKKMGASQIYWRDPSPKTAYCRDCHENFDRGLGGIPSADRAW
jgi:hypothetical protein